MRHYEKSILFGVTASISLAFLRGHVRLLGERGWRTGVSSAPTVPGQLQAFAQQERATALPVDLEREIELRADFRALWQMYRALRLFRPTILHVGTPKAGLIGGLAGALARVPVRIYTLHGLRLETVTGTRRRLLTLAERVAMACAHRVVCVSPSLERRVHELGLTAAHKTVVLGAGSPNGVRRPPPVQAEETARLRERLGLHEERPVIGFVGRLTRDKGLAELIDAFALVQARIPDAALLLIGEEEDGDPLAPSARAALQATAGIYRTGFVPDVYPYYPLMRVLALPTYREGFPTVALEASAFGLPVVTTDATGARDAVQPGVTGWRVPVGDAGALAQALTEALADPHESRRRGEAGRRWVQEHFDPDAVQERWADYYGELLRWRDSSRQYPEKRWLDLAVAGVALGVLGGPMLLLALLVRVKLGQPVLFRQVRPGLAGQPFTMFKFRTMTDQRGPDGELLPDARRLTPFGAWMRSTSLDELPELLNVLKGDMSLVGPRPLLMEYLPLYTHRQARRHEVRPGVTGWAQVNGRNALSWEEKFELDEWYVDHRSVLLDLRILLMTVQKVLLREGVSAHGETTMPKFRGSEPGTRRKVEGD